METGEKQEENERFTASTQEINASRMTSDLQTFLVFSQHPAQVILPLNWREVQSIAKMKFKLKLKQSAVYSNFLCRFEILAITVTHLDRKIYNRQLEIDNYKIIRRDRDANTIGGDVFSTSPNIYAQQG